MASSCGDTLMRYSCRSFLGEMETESLERLHVPAPVRQHFDPEVEIHRAADERLHLLSRHAADRPDTRAFRTDEDALLAVALDVEHRTNVHRHGVLPKLLDL